MDGTDMNSVKRHWIEAVAVVFTLLLVAGFVVACSTRGPVRYEPEFDYTCGCGGQAMRRPPLPPGHERVTASGAVDARHGAKEAWSERLDKEFTPPGRYRPDTTHSASNASAVMKRISRRLAPVAPAVSEEAATLRSAGKD